MSTRAGDVPASAPAHEPPNPVHHRTRPDTRWTRVNFAEAIQGVQTPLGWTFWSRAMEESVVQAFFNLGTLRRPALPPGQREDGFAACFYGRAAGNVDVFHYVGDRMPGSSGDIVVEKLLGKPAGPDAARRPAGAYGRYPAVAVKLPRAVRRCARVLAVKRLQIGDWWRGAVLERPPRELDDARRLLSDACRGFVEVGVHHATVSMLGNGLLDQLSELSIAATGDGALAMELATGFGGMEELSLIEDLFAAAAGQLEPAELVRRHGYHGPDEGNLAATSWREDPAPLEALVEAYRRRGDLEHPRERERRQIAQREQAQRRLLESLPLHRRGQARIAMRLARRYIPLREVGKAGFLHTLDAARCATRAAGAALAAQGVLEDREDAFFLTYDELTSPLGKTERVRGLVAERRITHERYQRLELPPYWTGEPVPVPLAQEQPAGAPVRELHGIGVAGERVSGRARVVHDPGSAELEPGDILVCATTDPSWTPLFMIAGGLAIDTGGAMSHGAIVARELGVPCVINTGTGTRDIADGATITLDVAAGLVTIDP
jgi:phosphohistidine swiveling domain-containing protein